MGGLIRAKRKDAEQGRAFQNYLNRLRPRSVPGIGFADKINGVESMTYAKL
jgi:hypothetical protein